ncbi:hypothetical protein H1R20_g1012, partial [Candolleomyces eurysporus]
MGVVYRVGPNVKNLSMGQRVVAALQIACGECEFCQRLSSMCDRTNNSSLQQLMYITRDAGFYGYSHTTGGFTGGQAEYVHVPRGSVRLLPIADHVLDEQVLYLSDILPTSYHAVVDTGVGKGETVAIWKFLMLETDVPEPPNKMVLLVRKMGRHGIIAACRVCKWNKFGCLDERVPIGNNQAPVHLYWKEILEEFILAGAFDPTFVLTHRLPLEDMPAPYKAFDERVPGLEKVIADTKFSEEFGKRGKGCPPLSRVGDWKTDTAKPQGFN